MNSLYPRFSFFLFVLLNHPGLHAQQISSQFYSQLSLPSGVWALNLVQTNDKKIWMAGENYTDGQAFILKCDDAGIIKWYTEFDGIPDQDEISSLAPASNGSCLFTYLHTDNTDKIGYGKIDSSGNVVWFNSCSQALLTWTNNLQVVPFGNNFVLAGSRLTNFGSDATMNLLRIDEDGNVLASAAFDCAPDKVKKILIDSQGSILICGDYYTTFSSRAFLAKTDSNFQSLSFHYYQGAVEQVHDAMINSSDEILFSGLKWEDNIGSTWSAALLKVNNNGEVIWGRRFVSSDWLVSEFFGIEKGIEPSTYFVIFEPEYFHANTNPFQTTGILQFTEDGIADTVFFRSDSTYFFTMLEKGKDSSYIEALTDPNSSNGVIWKSSNLVRGMHLAGIECLKGVTYDYPLSTVTVSTGNITCTVDDLLSFSPESIQQQFSSHSQQLSCAFSDTVTLVEEINSNEILSITPNPCSDFFHLSSKNQMREIAVADVTGRIVLSKTINSRTQDIEVSQWPAGIYFCRIKFQDHKISMLKIEVEGVTQH